MKTWKKAILGNDTTMYHVPTFLGNEDSVQITIIQAVTSDVYIQFCSGFKERNRWENNVSCKRTSYHVETKNPITSRFPSYKRKEQAFSSNWDSLPPISIFKIWLTIYENLCTIWPSGLFFTQLDVHGYFHEDLMKNKASRFF